MQDCSRLPCRVGPLIILTNAEGDRIALRDTMIRAIIEAPTCQVVLATGERLSINSDFDALTRTVAGPLRR